MHLYLIIILIGLFGLWFGSDLLIKSTKNLASHFGISPFFFGLFFVSVGTSIPEISVSIAGALQQLQGIETSGIVIGDKVGSAIVNITLFLSVLLLFLPTALKTHKKHLQTLGISLLGSLLFFFLCAADGIISFFDSIFFLFAYFLYFIYLFKTEKITDGRKPGKIFPRKDIFLAFIGLGFVLLSSHFVVSYSVKLAALWHVSQSIIGIFILGVGTGLPEFSVVLLSIRHRVPNLSIGDLLGSNSVDLLLATGLGGIISSFRVDLEILMYDLPFLFIATACFLYFVFTKKKLGKMEGASLFVLFAAYCFLRLYS